MHLLHGGHGEHVSVLQGGQTSDSLHGGHASNWHSTQLAAGHTGGAGVVHKTSGHGFGLGHLIFGQGGQVTGAMVVVGTVVVVVGGGVDVVTGKTGHL